MADVRLKLTDKERALYNSMFNEAAFMRGTPVQYFPIKKKDITGVSSEVYEWDDPIDIDVIYNERPKPSLLKKMDWYTEDPSIQPRLLFVPMFLPDGNAFFSNRGDLVRVKTDYNSDNEDNLFQVSIVRTDLVPRTFVCNIVPYRKPVQPEKEVSKNNKWLNIG